MTVLTGSEASGGSAKTAPRAKGRTFWMSTALSAAGGEIRLMG